MSGRPACDDPNASRMRSVGELASVQAIPRVFQSVLSLVDITDLTLSCEASPGNGCLAGVWCCMARLRTKWSRGSPSHGGSRRPASPDSCYRCVYTGSPLLLPYYAGGFTARLARWSLVFTGCNFKSLEGLSRFGGELSLALVC